MVICGDDGLAHRLAVELDAVCGEAVTVVLPSRRDGHGAEIAALHRDPHSPVELLVSAHPDEQTLRAAGVQRAAALALTYGDDQVNMTAALLARGLNPSERLVIRMFNRDRGRHLERLLDRAAAEVTGGGDDDPRADMSTTVLSDADTAVPELVATATVGHGHTLQVEGKVFRGVVRPAGSAPRSTDLATLAVLSGAHEDDPASEDSAETPGEDGTPRRAGDDAARSGHPHDRGAAASGEQTGMRVVRPPAAQPRPETLNTVRAVSRSIRSETLRSAVAPQASDPDAADAEHVPQEKPLRDAVQTAHRNQQIGSYPPLPQQPARGQPALARGDPGRVLHEEQAWEEWNPGFPLVRLASERRTLGRPIASYVCRIAVYEPHTRVTVLIPEVEPVRLWQRLLQNQRGAVVAHAVRRDTDAVICRLRFRIS
ncbi:NAD-binding protein [Streptomyces mirabilis]|uniref:NAD-binding protein n=1 Tax=Streptomyces mirabilis TaxID=68239 RepID=UPI0028F6DC70|nr:NAD-binding protein [Streptomyces mirabilis]